MEEKPFIWTDQLTKKLCQMKFDNECLFKKRKQPWSEFYKILLENGFPEEMTIEHVRKKWSYTWDTYKLAKKNRKKNWKYYKLFEKHYGKQVVLDKFESWPDEWRIKLINCMSQGPNNVESEMMWRTVEMSLRTQDLPIDCCIQDIKGLWHHLNTTFQRKHRFRLKKSTENTEWSLYNTMLDYYKQYKNDELVALESDWQNRSVYPPKISDLKIVALDSEEQELNEEEIEFNWTKNSTECFIQLRFQNDLMFKERPQAWKEFILLLRKEYNFPHTLTSREACRKWATIIGDYQKAKATNNTSWLYYHLFELYLGEGKLSLNPLVDWQEEWVFQLISAKTELEDTFEYSNKDRNDGWREVEKRLRLNGIPLDHSLLDITEIWTHLQSTFRWKKKFKTKGVLSEHWPYYEAMEKYTPNPKPKIERQKRIKHKFLLENDFIDNDDCEDDMKLFDLKQKLEVLRPKDEFSDLCRTCAEAQASVNIFEHKGDSGTSLATKLIALAGIEIEQTDNLPTQICYDCLQELENAYIFRQKCQKSDQHFRASNNKIKIEYQTVKNDDIPLTDDLDDDMDRTDYENENTRESIKNKPKIKVVKTEKIRRKIRVRKSRYDYWKICEICGKNTKNLISHLDTHNTDKKYSCDVCDKKFKFKSGLIIHKAIHNSTPKKTCEVCGKTFHILAQYRKHFVYHANERRFECETCGKRFNTLDILRVHNMTHTDERPFACSECGKTFRTAGCVSRHKRIVHRSIKKT